MFHHNKNNSSSSSSSNSKLGGLFHHNNKSTSTTSTTTSTTYGGVGTGYQQHGSTASDWDHYAVRHEEALIGDPIPVVNNNLNLAADRSHLDSNLHNSLGSSGNSSLSGNSKNNALPTPYDKNGNLLTGPVTANGPLAGNYSSGTVVENNLAGNGQTWGSAAWGGEPLYGGSSSAPLYGYRDQRDVATPLLPDNPWTHNELGRDYSDAYRTGTLPYSSINSTFVAPPVTESYHTSGPNGEIIDGTVTRQVREDILPPLNGLGTNTTSNTTTVVKEKIIPLASSIPIAPMPAVRSAPVVESIRVEPAILVEETILPTSRGIAIVETETPVEVLEINDSEASSNLSSGYGSSSLAGDSSSKVPPMAWYNNSSNVNQTRAI